MEFITNLTTGELFFYGGITCGGMALLLLLITSIVFASSRKRLRKKLDKEYGNKGD